MIKRKTISSHNTDLIKFYTPITVDFIITSPKKEKSLKFRTVQRRYSRPVCSGLARAFVARVNNPNLPFRLSFPRLPARPASGRLGARLHPRTAHRRRPTEGSGIDHAQVLTFAPAGGTAAPAGAVVRARAPLSPCSSLSLSRSIIFSQYSANTRHHGQG